MANLTGTSYEFGPFKLDPAKRLLVRDGQNLALARKTFDLLMILVEGRGRVFTKNELMSALWPNTFVEEGNLAFQISSLRKVLGEKGTEWIETLPRYGYRFCGEVAEIDSNLHPETHRAQGEQHTALNGEDSGAFETGVLGDPAIGAQSSTRSRIHLDRSLRYALFAVFMTLVAVALAITHFTEHPASERAVRFQIAPPEHIRIWDYNSVALSPDGDRLVFIGVSADSKRQLFLRAVGSLTSKPLKDTELVDAAFWSPDSRSVGFFAGGKLKKLDVQSGSIQVICDNPIGRSSGTWNREGVILFESSKRREIYRVAAFGGGDPKPLRSLEKNEERHSSPQFLPDGRHYIYFVQGERPETTGIYVASLDSKSQKRLVNSFTNADYAQLKSGASYLLFTRGSELMAQSFDLAKLELVGVPFRLVERIFIEVTAGIARAVISASRKGVIAYRSQETQGSTELVWLDRNGKRVGVVGGPGDYSNPSLSPDEKKLIVSRADPQIFTRDLWLFDLPTGTSSRFTFGSDDEDFAVWSRDGSRVAFNVVHNGVTQVYQRAVAGTSEPEPLLKPESTSNYKAIRSWSPDGRFLIFGTGPNTWAMPTGGDGTMVGPYSMAFPRVSPNGNWIAYTSDESGQTEVYVESFPKSEGKWQISNGGGTEPEWRSDGRELYYISGDHLVAMEVRTDLPAFEPGTSKDLFKLQLETRRRRRYQVAAGGQRFLANVPLRSALINVEVNWTTKVDP